MVFLFKLRLSKKRVKNNLPFPINTYQVMTVSILLFGRTQTVHSSSLQTRPSLSLSLSELHSPYVVDQDPNKSVHEPVECRSSHISCRLFLKGSLLLLIIYILKDYLTMVYFILQPHYSVVIIFCHFKLVV